MRVVDLFAGCGGMSLGFIQAGYEVVCAFDNWAAAVEVYRSNFRHPIFEVDLSRLDTFETIAAHQPDMIIGGPPCQDFSSAGKRDEGLGRADLTITFAEIISAVKPRWFVMENVERIRHSAVLKTAKFNLSAAGYGMSQIVLNASLCGVPQNRKRYFLIGELKGQSGAIVSYLKKNLSNAPMTVQDYLGDSLGLEYYYRHPRSYKRRAIFSIYEPSPTVRGVNRPVPGTYKKHPNDAATPTANLRPLTTLERSYIQTFPKDFIFEGTKTDLEQMIGNAVPVSQARFVAACIKEYIIDRSRGEVIDEKEPVQLKLF